MRLSETFTDCHKYNKAFKEKVEKEMSSFYNHYNENYGENVNHSERKVNKNVNLGNQYKRQLVLVKMVLIIFILKI